MTREPSRLGNQRPLRVWIALFALCTVLSMLGWAYFEATMNVGPAVLIYLSGQLLVGAAGTALVGFYSGSRHKSTLRTKARLEHARLVRRRLLLVPIAQIPIMAVLTPVAFDTRPGDYSIFGVIPALAALGIGAVGVGIWLGKKVVVPAADFVWDPPKHGTRGGRVDRFALCLLLVTSLFIGHELLLLYSVTPPDERANYWFALPSLIGLHIPGVTQILHPTTLWVSRVLLLMAFGAVGLVVSPRTLLRRVLPRVHKSPDDLQPFTKSKL